MDKKKSILNISISIISRILLLVAAFLVRRFLIRYIGNDVNGLNSLFTSIIGMLAVAELGVGSAIAFSMYEPIVAGDRKRVNALYCLYQRLYWIIGAVIFAAGLAVMPFLPFLIGDYEALNVNVYRTFFLTLLSVVLSYLYSAKTALIEAHKNNYITTGILTVSRLIRCGLQIAAILIWRSFTAYLVCQIVETLMIWGLTEIVVRRNYEEIISGKEPVSPAAKAGIVRNIKAMFLHRVGTILVNTTDSLIISGFIGVVILGKYSNYNVVAAAVTSIITLFFSPLTAVVGHLCAAGDPAKTRSYFNFFYCLNFILGVVFYLGYYAVIDYVVSLCFGDDLGVSRAIAFIITLNQFTQYMRRASLLFRDASGAFYYDRWKPIAEGVVNLLLSLLFVLVFPEDFKVVGVIVATIITTLLICDVVEPRVVFRHVFGQSPRRFYVRNYAYTALFIGCLVGMTFLRRECDGEFTGLVVNGLISLTVSATAFGLVAAVDRTFREEVRKMMRKVMEGMKRLGRK